eukprot:5408755-Pyramimonas_sp.AAC.1
MARCHGHLLHIASMEAIMDSTLGNGIIICPSKHDGLCKAPDYGILILIPTKHEFLPEHAQ